jgi:hypothetical protein
VVHFGAGAFGLGFVGDLLSGRGENGLTIVSHKPSDVSESLGKHCCYDVLYRDIGQKRRVRIRGAITATSDNSSDLDGLLEDERTVLITTAVQPSNLCRTAPVMYRGLKKRLSKIPTSPLLILACENMTNNSTALEREIRKYAAIKGDFDFGTQLGHSAIRFSDTVVDRICHKPAVSDQGTVEVEAEDYYGWVLDVSGVQDVHRKVLSELLPSGAILENSRNRFDGHSDIKYWLFNGIHHAVAIESHVWNLANVSDALANPDVHALILQLQTEFAKAFMTKHKDIAGSPPFDQPSLDLVNSQFIRRVITSNDLADRILHDLLSFGKIGGYQPNALIEHAMTTFDRDAEGVRSSLLSALGELLRREASFFVKLRERLLDPIKLLTDHGEGIRWIPILIRTLLEVDKLIDLRAAYWNEALPTN